MNPVTQRKEQRKANRAAAKIQKLVEEEASINSALAEVKSKIAKLKNQPVQPEQSSSSSVHKVTIQPAKQSVIFLKTPGDAAHQITFNFREPEGSGKLTRLRFLCTQFLWTPSQQEHHWRSMLRPW
jgi:hypothetical protein